MSCVRIKATIFCVLLFLFSLGINAREQKLLYLTFDDGPHPRHTEVVLDVLQSQGVRATFFTVGTNVVRFPELVAREISEGHSVANHTYSHHHMNSLDDNEFAEELVKWEEAMYSGHRYTSKLFRPPEGILSTSQAAVLARLGYDTVLWTVDTRDWAHESVESIVDNVLSNAGDGAVILFHDFVAGDSPTPKALEILIPKLKAMGYSFEVL